MGALIKVLFFALKEIACFLLYDKDDVDSKNKLYETWDWYGTVFMLAAFVVLGVTLFGLWCFSV